MVTCPTCGSVVPEDRLSDDTEFVALIDRVPMTPLCARLFLKLWNADGRYLARENAIDYLTLYGMEPSDQAFNTVVKRMRQTIREAGIPVRVHTSYGVGIRMERYPGWHWRKLKTQLQWQVESDDFHFNLGG